MFTWRDGAARRGKLRGREGEDEVSNALLSQDQSKEDPNFEPCERPVHTRERKEGSKNVISSSFQFASSWTNLDASFDDLGTHLQESPHLMPEIPPQLQSVSSDVDSQLDDLRVE